MFYDNAADALREACKDEHNKYPKFPLKAKCLGKDTPIAECDFGALVNHLIDGARTTGPSSYFEELCKVDLSPFMILNNTFQSI